MKYFLEKIKNECQSRWKRFGNHLYHACIPPTRRQIKGCIVLGVSMLLYLILFFITEAKKSTLYDQQMAKRWSGDGGVAQLTCFYPISETEKLDDYYFLNLEHTLEKNLQDASIQAQNEKARLFSDAYSITGSITIQSDYGVVTVAAIGVEGDFFGFHPVELLGGNYIDRDNLMKDGILIDEDTAWQLFGSNDVSGMNVMIDGVLHHIAGVVNRKEGYFENAAGLDRSLCYVSLETLKAHGKLDGSYAYEIVMPNPVSNFAMTMLHTAVAGESKPEGDKEEDSVWILENSRRFDFYPLLIAFKDFGIRSMSKNGIVYPYWENIARAYEDLFARLTAIRLLLVVLDAILIVGYLHGLRHRLKCMRNEGEKL